jgi:hypothetical protein
MTKELVPLSSFENVGLPEYVPADQIGINMHALGRIAGWGCMQRDVDIVSYNGPTTPRNAGVVGFDSQGTAVAGGTADPEEVPRGAYELHYDEREIDTKVPPYWQGQGLRGLWHTLTGHSRPELTLTLNLPEIQQRLQDKNAKLRDPKVWTKEIHNGLADGLKAATRHHLTVTLPSVAEASVAMMLLLPESAGSSILTHYSSLEGGVPAVALYIAALGAFVEVSSNTIKAVSAKHHGLRISEAAYSLIPGYHLDRCLAVAGLTKLHRLARPIKS